MNEKQIKKNNKRVVLVGGCFDLIHYGHVEFLREAKNAGDHLIVLLESDESVRRMKGESRPIHTQEQRKAMLESLRVVDEVIMLKPLLTDDQYKAVIDDTHPDIIALTEGDPIEDRKRRQAESIGADVLVIPKIHTPSTSQLAKLLGLE